jgi:hypothetical protein
MSSVGGKMNRFGGTSSRPPVAASPGNVEPKRFYLDGFMDLSKYQLERAVLDAQWDAAVEQSPQGTLFATSTILSCLKGVRPGLWIVLKDRQPVAALCLIESDDGRRAIECDSIVYAGLMFMPSPAAQGRAQGVAEQFRIASFCTAKLVECYEDIFIALSPAFVDIRPFLWHNYAREGVHFVPDVRFTSLVELPPNPGASLESDPVYLAASKSRRQQIRYGRSKGVTTRASAEVALLIDLYARTFARQGKEVDAAALERLGEITGRLIECGRGRLYLSRTADGEIGSAAVFGWDAKRAYYVYGANAPDLRDDHTGTMVLWDALVDLRAHGITEVDLEGVNSPLRGHFKLSFGGSVTPYYHLALRR